MVIGHKMFDRKDQDPGSTRIFKDHTGNKRRTLEVLRPVVRAYDPIRKTKEGLPREYSVKYGDLYRTADNTRDFYRKGVKYVSIRGQIKGIAEKSSKLHSILWVVLISLMVVLINSEMAYAAETLDDKKLFSLLSMDDVLLLIVVFGFVIFLNIHRIRPIFENRKIRREKLRKEADRARSERFRDVYFSFREQHKSQYEDPKRA